MNSDLKRKLFSGIVQSTKSERMSYKLPNQSAVSFGRIVATSAIAMAVIGLLMLVTVRLKILF